MTRYQTGMVCFPIIAVYKNYLTALPMKQSIGPNGPIKWLARTGSPK